LNHFRREGLQDVKSYGRVRVATEFYGRDKMHYMASQAVYEHDYEPLHDSHLDLQERMHHLIAFLAEMMGDIMYLHQALRRPDTREYVEAVIKEINGHIYNDHWKLIPRTEAPEDTEVVPSIWAMQHKQDLLTGRVTKHKARLNIHGGKQEFGTNYYETYAPVVTWFAILLLIVFDIQFHWALCQVDFVMAYPQAPIEMDMYMELPTGIHTKHGSSKDHVLNLLANAVILGDPYAKKSILPHIGVTSRLPVSPSIPNHRILGQSCLLNRLALPHTLSRRAPLE
jgi:hypothetical protein